MRIAVLTRFAHRVGGIETYLEAVLPALAARGHQVKVWFEFNAPAGTDLFLSESVERQFVPPEHASRARRLADLAAWRPDVTFSHGMVDVAGECELQSVAPFVVLLHAYDGACISGYKTHAFPSPQPCSQRLGPACLLQYHARRCGGISPVTMVRNYREQRLRQTALRSSAMVVTLSDHMRLEAVTQGVSADRVVRVQSFAPQSPDSASDSPALESTATHITFMGRMEQLKGADLLLDAVARLPTDVSTHLAVTVVGDGRRKPDLERRAQALTARGIAVRFPGWLTRAACRSVLRSTQLLVMPGVWPEPLGLVGLEAAAEGVPCLAFDVGGISDWLEDGVTGRLVKGKITAAQLADGLVDCLRDRSRLRQWGRAAARVASLRTIEIHIRALEDVLERAARSTGGTRLVGSRA